MNNEYKALRVKEPTHKKVKLQAVQAGKEIAEYVEWMADTVQKLGIYPPKPTNKNPQPSQ